MNVHAGLVSEMPRRPDGETLPASDIDPPSAIAIFLAAAVLLLGAYTLVFAVTIGEGVATSFRSAVSNVLPLALISAATYRLLRDVILRRGVLFQASVHLMLAPGFAISWYFATLFCLALTASFLSGTFEFGRFSGIALVWQLFQGIVLYALVAAITYALRGGRLASSVHLVTSAEPLERYLTRNGDELIPVEVGEIVLIRGAQDYAEVVTLCGKGHLVRMSLAEFEVKLPRSKFLRVHRSTIVNLSHLGRAEPIGSGRMALHMGGGMTVQASRAGAQALRVLVL